MEYINKYRRQLRHRNMDTIGPVNNEVSNPGMNSGNSFNWIHYQDSNINEVGSYEEIKLMEMSNIKPVFEVDEK
jgi:hypothetical protein